jgi:hypothetical protein
LKHLLHSISEWHSQYNIYAQSLASHSHGNPADAEKQYEALAFCFTCLIITNRLIYALDPEAEFAHEGEAQRLAAEIEDVERSAMSINARAKLFLPLKMHVAGTARSTAAKWRDYGMSRRMTREERSPMMEKEVFGEWCVMIGWKNG